MFQIHNDWLLYLCYNIIIHMKCAVLFLTFSYLFYILQFSYLRRVMYIAITPSLKLYDYYIFIIFLSNRASNPVSTSSPGIQVRYLTVQVDMREISITRGKLPSRIQMLPPVWASSAQAPNMWSAVSSWV